MCTLSPDERDRKRFIAARSELRRLLSRYTQCPAHLLRFTYGDHGKPSLERPPYADPIGLNVTHSGEWALYAVAPTPTVGVDVECVRTDFDAAELAAMNFSAAEQAALRRLPLQRRTEAFFDCWTQKEAFVKAEGQGLSIPLSEFDVRIGGCPELCAIGGDAARAERWTLRAADPAPGYLGALAVEGAAWEVRFFDGAGLRKAAWPPRRRSIASGYSASRMVL
jgi:4'-phosphopantetheinyl transferase